MRNRHQCTLLPEKVPEVGDFFDSKGGKKMTEFKKLLKAQKRYNEILEDQSKILGKLKEVDNVRLLKQISRLLKQISRIAELSSVKIRSPILVAIATGGYSLAKALELIAEALEELTDLEQDEIEDLITKHTDKYTDDDD